MGFREYEVRNKPLFASMRRAKAALSQKHCAPCEIDYFFDYIEIHYGVDSQNVEFVTFYDYYDHQGKFQYNIAYVYTTPSLKMRNVLFEDREKITNATGWYPMVSGKRANFSQLKNSVSCDFYGLMKHKPPYVHLGKPLSIKSVATDISSTAMLLKCEHGNILLDTGFDVDAGIIDQIDFVFVSHFHKDHTGGLYELLRVREIPIIISSITLEYLINISSIEQHDKERLIRNAVLIERIKNNTQITCTLEFFDSFHCPGAYGIKYKYYDECVIYPGDMCLSNEFYDFSGDFSMICQSESKEKTTVITDCALVPRGDFAITDEDFKTISAKVEKSSENQMFVSRSCETLFNVYIRLFKLAVQERKQWLFVVSDELFNLLQSTLRMWLLPAYSGDPFIKHVIGTTRINYAETQKLYNVSNVEQFAEYKDNKVIYLLTVEDLREVSQIVDTSTMDVFLTGPIAVARNIDELMSSYSFGSVHKLSSPDWSFHSDKKAILNMLCKSTDLRYILFHAYPKDMKRFLREIGEEYGNRIGLISKNELKL